MVPLTIDAVALHLVAELGLEEVPAAVQSHPVTVHRPITVNGANFEEAGRLIVAALSGPPERPRRAGFWRRHGLTVASGQW